MTAEVDPSAIRLFVTKIPPQVPREEIAEYFARFGTTTDVYVPTIPGATFHKGIAFISFSDPGSLQIAMGSGPHELGGQEIVIDVATPKGTPRGGGGGGFAPAPQAPAPAPVEQATGDRIFVTKVPPNIDREQLRVYFEQFGGLTDVYMPAAPGSAIHKGICFVSFADPQSVQACLAHQPHEVNGCQVVVDLAAPRGAPGQQRGGMMHAQQAPQRVQYVQQPAHQAQVVQYVQQPPQQVRYVQQPVQQVQQFQHVQVQQPPPRGAYMAHQQQGRMMVVQQPMVVQAPPAPVQTTGAPVSGRLFLTRVPPDITRVDLQLYFQQFGELQDVFVPNGGKGIAFVSFVDHDVAQQVLQQRQHFVKEGQFQPLNVEQAMDRPAWTEGKPAPRQAAPAAQFGGAHFGGGPPMLRPAAGHFRPY